jgi:hypothetical protein
MTLISINGNNEWATTLNRHSLCMSETLRKVSLTSVSCQIVFSLSWSPKYRARVWKKRTKRHQLLNNSTTYIFLMISLLDQENIIMCTGTTTILTCGHILLYYATYCKRAAPHGDALHGCETLTGVTKRLNDTRGQNGVDSGAGISTSTGRERTEEGVECCRKVEVDRNCRMVCRR